MSTADYKTMTTAEIREDFLRFFEEKGCKLCPSSSLVPDDPSLLLTNAGMNQFKEYYQGKKTMAEIGATSCQKCLRTNDIDNIGDATHLSFFEMLGNFSFGGYTKADAIAWAYDFITSPEHLGLPKERLYMTVFEDDDEAIELWHAQGVPYDHISRLGADDNFWAAGPTGPCGPCSEIYFDQGEEFGCGKPTCGPGCDDCNRFLEFWNLVFTQYDRQEDGSMPDLPHKNIDTGMGLERIAAIMQHKSTNYDGDLLQSLIAVGARLSGRSYGEDESADRSLRIVADHSRAVTFMIGDGILPGNEGRGYVLRRLLRRAVYHGRLLGIEGPFLSAYVDEVCRLMGDVYPAIVENRALIEGIVAAEEERFGATLAAGEESLNSELESLAEGAVLPGEVAFKLHDTYGFPIDLTREICAAAGYEVDMDAFDACMTEQRERARASANRDAWGTFNDVWTELSDTLAATEFCGYDANEATARVLAIVAGGASVERAAAGDEVEVVLDRTPFYAEMGGQVGDTGTLATAAGARLRVSDTTSRGSLYAHVAQVEEGTLAVGDEVTAAIDAGRRELIRRNHTATHLLDAALKKVLGEHVSQAGSLVAPDRLRFDFTHFEAVTADELARIEGMVNAEIFAAEPIVTRVMGLEEAKASGAVALFGEKYGDVVRVVSTGESDEPFSRELCGGTHARNTADLGLFKIVSESSVGSNARRIEAVTSMGAIEYLDERLLVLDEAAHELKCRPTEVAERIGDLRAQVKELDHKLKDALLGASSDKIGQAMDAAVDAGAYKAVIARVDGLEAKELRGAWDTIREKSDGPVACLLVTVTPEGKVALLAGATDAAVAAGFSSGDLIRKVAGCVGGRGGGRPNMAQAGGTDPSGIEAALDAAREALGLA
ncbi:alanine--tRNA ligase [Olsenella profusa]|uniref:Alanine--tRNA ligase n=1 Tax=Olsenella profusa TaxID=138595 RepID=A0ABS2F3E9_9ACTN|nr:alanine--tRNA ligase [Olsenella profusa]MBM6775322.1 alanine--tRNA ligase [Olsenella profusa]